MFVLLLSVILITEMMNPHKVENKILVWIEKHKSLSLGLFFSKKVKTSSD